MKQLLFAGIVCAVFQICPANGAYRTGWLDNLQNLPQHSSADGRAFPVRLSAAANETEHFQLLVRPEPADTGLAGVTLFFNDLRDEAGNFIPAENISWRLEYYHTLNVPSEGMDKTPMGLAGQSGKAQERWPDALLRVHSFDIAPGDIQALWCQVRVPAQQPPGIYRTTASLIPADAERTIIPIEVQVYDFHLPERLAFVNMSDPQVMDGLDRLARGSQAWVNLLFKRRLWLLDHGISGGYLQSEQMRTDDWMPLQHWPAAKEHESILTHRQNRTYALTFDADDFIDPVRAARVKQSVDFVRGEKWDQNLTFIYRPDDEPPADRYPVIRAACDQAHRTDPGIRTLLACYDIAPGLYGAIDIWCPSLGNVRDSWEAKFRERQAAGEDIWFYGNDFTFPVDVGAVHHRVPGMMAAKLNMRGQYIFGVNWWIGPDGEVDPFDDITGGANTWNGGSYLVYPNYKFPDQELFIGSMRLDLLTEYREDFEYFELLRARLDAALEQLGAAERPEFRYAADNRAWELAHTLVRGVNDYETDTDKWFALRHAVAEEIIAVPTVPVAVFNSALRSGESGDVADTELHLAIESGSTVLCNDEQLTPAQSLPQADIYAVTLPLAIGANRFDFSIRKGDAVKNVTKVYTLQPDPEVRSAIARQLEQAREVGVALPSAMAPSAADFVAGRQWTAAEKAELTRALETLNQQIYQRLLEQARASALPPEYQEKFLASAADAATRGQWQTAIGELRNLLAVTAIGACRIEPVVVGDYPGYRLRNGVLTLELIRPGARIISLDYNQIPLFFHGFIRPLDIGDGAYRDIGGLEEVIGSFMDYKLTMGTWDYRIAKATADEIVLDATILYDCKIAGRVELRRRLRLEAERSDFTLEYTLTNRSGKAAEIYFRSHYEPAIGANAENRGGDPVGDRLFVAGRAEPAFAYTMTGARHEDFQTELTAQGCGVYDPDEQLGLIFRSDRLNQLYSWIDRSDDTPYRNPWNSTRNKYTMEPNNCIGNSAAPFPVAPGESVTFTNTLTIVKAADAAEFVRQLETAP